MAHLTKPIPQPKRVVPEVKGVAKRVYQQLITDFPAPAIEWVKHTHWMGPALVPMEAIDFDNRANWAASHEPDKVQIHIDLIKEGKSKPIILAKMPDNDKLVCLDAHHRLLAYEALGKEPEAFIADVKGPDVEKALTMHDKQYSGRSKLDGV